ncbi:MAG: DUF5989 family protein [Caldilineaceae bacterium]
MKRIAAYAGLGLFYVLLTVILSEGWVRLFRLAPPPVAPSFFWRIPDPVTGWALEPGAQGRWFNSMVEYDVAVTVNERGLRSPQAIDYAKPAGVYRILVLGDSYVEALQMPLAASFPQQLAARLNDWGATVEVINAGVSGWGTDQQFLWLREEGRKYQPDLILLAIFPGNDFMNNHMPLEFTNFGSVRKPWFTLQDGELVVNNYPFNPDEARQATRQFREALRQSAGSAEEATDGPALPPFTATGEWLKSHSALYRYLEPRLRIATPQLAMMLVRWGLLPPGQESSDAVQGPAYIPVTYGVYQQPPTAEWEAAFAVTGALFTAVHDLAREQGAAVAAVLITAPEQVDAARWTRTLAQYPAMQQIQWSLAQPTQKAAELLATAGIPVLDLLPDFRATAAAGIELHLPDDGHWTAAGHTLAGGVIAEFLGEAGFIPTLAGQALVAPRPRTQPAVGEWLVWIVAALLGVSLLWSLYKTGPGAWVRNLGVSLGTVGELLLYVIRRRQFILLPVVLILLIFGGLLVIAQASVVGPFIYTLF